MRKSIKNLTTIMIAIVLTFSLTSCKKSWDTVRIASVGPLSGDVEVYGSSVKEGIELAIEEINAAGGIQVGDTKKQVEWMGMVDDTGNPEKAGTAFNKQYKKGIDVMIGAVTSGPTENLISQAVKKSIPVITPTGTADHLTVGVNGNEREIRSNVFRACFNDSYQGTVAAKFVVNQLEKTKLAVIYNNSDSYSLGLRKSFVEMAQQLGATIVKESVYQTGVVDFATIWDSILASDAEVVFIPDYYEQVANIVTQGRTKGYTGTLVGGDGWDGIFSVEGVKAEDFNDCYFMNHFAADSTEESIVNFVEKYKQKNHKAPNSWVALGYDAVYIYKAAVEKAGTLDYAKVIEALSASDFCVSVVTGNITFDANGNAVKPAVVMQYVNGEIKYFSTVA